MPSFGSKVSIVLDFGTWLKGFSFARIVQLESVEVLKIGYV